MSLKWKTWIPILALCVLAWPLFKWSFVQGRLTGTEPELCQRPITADERALMTEEGTLPESGTVKADGACWPAVWDNVPILLFGRFPEAERWRALAALALPCVVLLLGASGKLSGPLLFGLVPIGMLVAVALAAGLPSSLGLEPVSTDLWGGFFLTLFISLFGLSGGFMLGLLLAISRFKGLPAFRFGAVATIELVRAVPLVTFLFMGHFMLPLFLPSGMTAPDPIVRALIIIMLFQSAYIAEAIRGGLQAIPKGQFEAAQALGFGFWKTMALVVLPQALRTSIPALINCFVGLFKDTGLVAIIGIFDLLGVARNITSNPKWAGRDLEPLIFAGLVFWIFCWGLTLWGRRLEEKFSWSKPIKSA